MIELVTRSRDSIQALHDHIWKVVNQVMEKAGRSVADGLGIALHLVDMLPTIPLQLAFNTATAGLFRCTPKVYAVRPTMGTDGLDFSYAPPPGSDRNAMTVLGDEILRSTRGTEEKAAQPTWLMTTASEGTVEVQVVEGKGGDYPNRPRVSCVSRSPTPRMLPSTGRRSARYLLPRSPLCSPPGAISRPLLSRLEIKAPFFRLQRIGFWQIQPIRIRLGRGVWYGIPRQWFQRFAAIPIGIS